MLKRALQPSSFTQPRVVSNAGLTEITHAHLKIATRKSTIRQTLYKGEYVKRDKKYPDTRFTVETLRECLIAIRADFGTKDLRFHRLEVDHGTDGVWEYDSEEEFFADYRKVTGEASLYISIGTRTLSVSVVSVDSP